MSRVCKVFPPETWDAVRRDGVLTPEGVDARDGYVHLSAINQVAGTLAKHFGGFDTLILVAFESDVWGPALRWERSRDDALFPHLYGPLRADAATGVWTIVRGADGVFQLPADL